VPLNEKVMYCPELILYNLAHSGPFFAPTANKLPSSLKQKEYASKP